MIAESKTKYLIVMRHGAQCPNNGLTERGKQQVQLAAQSLKTSGIIPDSLITSFPKRAQMTGSILSRHFQAASTQTADLLDVLNPDFDIKTFLNAAVKDKNTVILSGHDETIQRFGHNLLNDQDLITLFQIIPNDRILSCPHEGYTNLHIMADNADMLILQNKNNADDINNWRLYGWMADGQIRYAHDHSKSESSFTNAKKLHEAADRIDLALHVPAAPLEP